MRDRSIRILVALVLSASCAIISWRPALGSPPAPSVAGASSLEFRLAAQRRLFADQVEGDRQRSPERMSAEGDLARNRELDDRSLAAHADADRQDRWFHSRLAAISASGMAEEDVISHDLMLFALERRISDYRLRAFELGVWSGGGVHEELAALPSGMPFDTPAHYQDYLRRLRAVPRVLAQATDLLRRARADRMMPPREEIAVLPQAVDAIVAANPFRRPVDAMPPGFEPQERTRFRRELLETIDDGVLPALRRFAAYLRNDYVPHGRRTWSEGALPDGAAIYRREIADRTTSDMTAAQVHALGLREVSRIDGELEAVAQRAGYGSLSAYRASLAADPRYRARSERQIVDDFRMHVDRMRPLLPKLFLDVPPTPLLIEAMRPGDRPAISHHVDGTPDGRTPGRILVATSDPQRRSLIGDETIAYHEGLPGHELQIAIAQRLEGLPPFRHELRFDAYGEGWAVYAEALGKEMGLFSDPASEYGRLNTELLRALRLVADTGMHAYGWSPRRVASYLRRSGAVDELTIAAEVDRIEHWPAQGLAYKVGQLCILALRRRAEGELGGRFDVREFHQQVLGSGSLPLPLLAQKIDRWAARERASGEAHVSVAAGAREGDGGSRLRPLHALSARSAAVRGLDRDGRRGRSLDFSVVGADRRSLVRKATLRSAQARQKRSEA